MVHIAAKANTSDPHPVQLRAKLHQQHLAQQPSQKWKTPITKLGIPKCGKVLVPVPTNSLRLI
eukprot:5782073-Amphidinium_carterae.1